MVMQVLALHRVLDLDQILARDVLVVLDRLPQDSQHGHLAVQRACEHGGQYGQNSDVQEAPHGDDDQWGLLLPERMS